MATSLSQQDLSQLPQSIQDILNQQNSGAGAPDPDLSQLGDSTLTDLSGALNRRFGQGQNYDPTEQAGIQSLIDSIPGVQNTYQEGQDQTNEDFMTAAQQLDKQNTLAMSQQQNNMADQGLGYSGANVLGQQRLGQAYQQQVFGANQSRARTLSGLTDQEVAAYQAIQDRSASLQGDAASRANVQDQANAWAAAQQQMEQQAQQQQQQEAAASLAQQQAQQQAEQQQIAAMEAQALAASQPVPDSGGSITPASTGEQVTLAGPGGAKTTYDTSNQNDVLTIQKAMLAAGMNVPQNGVWTTDMDTALNQYNALTNQQTSKLSRM